MTRPTIHLTNAASFLESHGWRVLLDGEAL